MVLGGNGIEEQFCPLPRLWRDAAILETWEGPYTLLLMQALSDLRKFGVAGREEEFLRFGLGASADSGLCSRLCEVLRHPDSKNHVLAWEKLAGDIYHAF